jgi:glutathione-regulated potassium-efflux system ancillary protein KefC
MDIDQLMLAAAILMTATAIAVGVAKKLNLGSTVALLAVGVALGPHSPHPLLVNHVDELHALGEIGVALLLFLLGLDVRPRRLWSLRRMVIGFGSLQYLLSAAAIAGLLFLLGPAHWLPVVLVGLGLAMSSAAIALAAIEERADTATPEGRTTIAVQILQAFVVIAVLAVIPILGSFPVHDVEPPSVRRVLEVLGAVIGVYVVGRYLLPRVLVLTARNLGSGAFGLIIIAAVFGAASLLDRLGISMALGAFMMGVALSTSMFVEQVKAAVAPTKGLLLGLFFITVGMAIEWKEVAAYGPRFLLLLVALLLAKFVVVLGLGLGFRIGRRAAILTALLLMPFDEVGYVIFGSARQSGLLTPRQYAITLALISASFILSPLLINLGYRLSRRKDRATAGGPGSTTLANAGDGQVVVAGYSYGGRGLCLMLEQAAIPYVVFEVDLERLALARSSKHNVHYGDVTDPTMMGAVAIARSRAVVVTTIAFEACKRMIDNLRRFYPDVPVMTAVQFLAQRDELQRMGARQVVALTPEGTLSFGRSVLTALGIAGTQADAIVASLQADDYAAMRGVGGAGPEDAGPTPASGQSRHASR